MFVILMVGLTPKDFFLKNQVTWLPDQNGLHFEQYGIAYTDAISDLINERLSLEKGFSIEIALKPKSFHEEGFNIIFMLHGGQDRTQLLIGQWRSYLIVMNGDDYAHQKKTKRISVKSTSDFPNSQLLTVTTDLSSTHVYLDGRLVDEKKDMRLEIPDGNNTRLLLGNSVYGNHSWQGHIYGIAVFGKVLSSENIEMHFNTWSIENNFSFAVKEDPFILYNFDEKGGTKASSHLIEIPLLRIPSNLKALTPNFFFRKWNEKIFNKSHLKDMDAVLNFFGFIPFGFLLAVARIRATGRLGKHPVWVTIAAGFLLSLLIETVQAWMPTRSSDFQDLILNTAGTLAGALCYMLIKERGKAPNIN